MHRPYSSMGTRCMHRPRAERGTKTKRRDGARSTGLRDVRPFRVGRGRGAVAFAAPRAPVGSVCLLRIRSTLFPCVLFWIGTRTTLHGAGPTRGPPLLVLRLTFSFRGCVLRTFTETSASSNPSHYNIMCGGKEKKTHNVWSQRNTSVEEPGGAQYRLHILLSSWSFIIPRDRLF
jgi:hypothetical protein